MTGQPADHRILPFPTVSPSGSPSVSGSSDAALRPARRLPLRIRLRRQEAQLAANELGKEAPTKTQSSGVMIGEALSTAQALEALEARYAALVLELAAVYKERAHLHEQLDALATAVEQEMSGGDQAADGQQGTIPSPTAMRDHLRLMRGGVDVPAAPAAPADHSQVAKGAETEARRALRANLQLLPGGRATQLAI